MNAPQPFVPADCDLRDFAFMPLDVVRLRDSDIAAVATGDEFRCAVLLWCASWHQVPAGSLPDDDIILSQLAGFGRVVREWQRVREGALKGWTKCSDGRLYHAVVAEKACEAWEGKQRHAHGKLCDRIRKQNKTRERQGQNPLLEPSYDEWISAGKPSSWDSEFHRKPPILPPESNEHSTGKEKPSAGIPTENALIGTVDRDSGQGEVNLKPIEAMSGNGAKPPAKYRREAVEILQFLNGKTGRGYRPVDANIDLIVARLKEPGITAQDIKSVIAMKVREWQSDPDMAQYLRPETLFNRTKFAQYHGQLVQSPDPQLTLTE